MSVYGEQPFSEVEERYFLAEILKRSSLPPAHLLNIIRETGVEPAWNEIALPNGRSVSACQHAFMVLSSRAQPGFPPTQPVVTDPSRRLKRPFSSMGDATTPLPRELQPRPPTFTSVNGQQVAIPPPAVMAPVEPQRKKRGRPTKSEFERRQQEARERGEVWPKPRKPKARPSTEGSEASSAARPVSGGSSASGEAASAAVSVSLPTAPAAAVAPPPIYSPARAGPSMHPATLGQPTGPNPQEQRHHEMIAPPPSAPPPQHMEIDRRPELLHPHGPEVPGRPESQPRAPHSSSPMGTHGSQQGSAYPQPHSTEATSDQGHGHGQQQQQQQQQQRLQQHQQPSQQHLQDQGQR